MEPSVAIGLEPKKRVMAACSVPDPPSLKSNLESTPCSSLLVQSCRIRRERIPVHLRQELREDRDKDQATNDGILAARGPSPHWPPKSSRNSRKHLSISELSEDPTLKSNLVKRRPREA